MNFLSETFIYLSLNTIRSVISSVISTENCILFYYMVESDWGIEFDELTMLERRRKPMTSYIYLILSTQYNVIIPTNLVQLSMHPNNSGQNYRRGLWMMRECLIAFLIGRLMG